MVISRCLDISQSFLSALRRRSSHPGGLLQRAQKRGSCCVYSKTKFSGLAYVGIPSGGPPASATLSGTFSSGERTKQITFFLSNILFVFLLETGQSEEGIHDDYGNFRSTGFRTAEITHFVIATNIKQPPPFAPPNWLLDARCWSHPRKTRSQKNHFPLSSPKSWTFSTLSIRSSPLPTLHPTL